MWRGKARLGLNPRAVPEQGQGSESDQWEVVRAPRAAPGLGPREARGHPDLTKSCCGFPTPCLATGESEGQPRMWSEDGRAPMRLAHGPCPVSVFPNPEQWRNHSKISNCGCREMGIGGLTPLTSQDPAPCSSKTFIYTSVNFHSRKLHLKGQCLSQVGWALRVEVQRGCRMASGGGGGGSGHHSFQISNPGLCHAVIALSPPGTLYLSLTPARTEAFEQHEAPLFWRAYPKQQSKCVRLAQLMQPGIFGDPSVQDVQAGGAGGCLLFKAPNRSRWAKCVSLRSFDQLLGVKEQVTTDR